MQDNDQNDATTEDRDETQQNLGRILQSARRAQELSVEQISAELRIEQRHLQALEDERFDTLGAPVFAKGYLKQYANRLGLDYDELLVEYYRLVEPEDVLIAPSRSIKLRDERQITVWIVAVLALLLLAVFLFVWWVREPETDERPSTAAPATTLPSSTPPAAAIDAGLNRTADVTRDPFAVEVLAVNSPKLGSVPSLALEDKRVETASDIRTVHVEVQFEQDSWTEIVDAHGERHFFDIGSAGTHSSFTGAVPIAFLLGNADGVRLLVDGESYAVPLVGRRGKVASFTLDVSDN